MTAKPMTKGRWLAGTFATFLLGFIIFTPLLIAAYLFLAIWVMWCIRDMGRAISTSVAVVKAGGEGRIALPQRSKGTAPSEAPPSRRKAERKKGDEAVWGGEDGGG